MEIAIGQPAPSFQRSAARMNALHVSLTPPVWKAAQKKHGDPLRVAFSAAIVFAAGDRTQKEQGAGSGKPIESVTRPLFSRGPLAIARCQVSSR